MVKNNGIPFEVKKPFETVCELKSEIPTFEEFMKDYKVDENLNYDDLSGGSMGEVKGYGPCYVCWEKPLVWKDLYISCPGWDEERKRECQNTRKSNWYHATDSGKTEISNRAHIKCTSCYTDRHMSHWVFNCGEHRGDNYWGTRRGTFRASLKIAMQIGDYEEFVDNLIAHMSSHRNDPEVRSDWK
jgi:hypothetical protein